MYKKYIFLMPLLCYAVFSNCTTYLCVSNNMMEAISMRIHNTNNNVIKVLRPNEFNEGEIELKEIKNIIISSSYENIVLDRRWESFSLIKKSFSIPANILSFSVFSVPGAKLSLMQNNTEVFILDIIYHEKNTNNCIENGYKSTIRTNQAWFHFKLHINENNISIHFDKSSCSISNIFPNNIHVNVNQQDTWILHNLSYYNIGTDGELKIVDPVNFMDYSILNFFLKSDTEVSVDNIFNKNANIKCKSFKDWKYFQIGVVNATNNISLSLEGGSAQFSNFYLSHQTVPRIINYTANNEEEVYCDLLYPSKNNNTLLNYNDECKVNVTKYCTTECIICCSSQCYTKKLQPPHIINFILHWYWYIAGIFIIIICNFAICLIYTCIKNNRKKQKRGKSFKGEYNQNTKDNENVSNTNDNRYSEMKHFDEFLGHESQQIRKYLTVSTESQCKPSASSAVENNYEFENLQIEENFYQTLPFNQRSPPERKIGSTDNVYYAFFNGTKKRSSMN